MPNDDILYDAAVDYKELYLKMVRKTESAINLLIEVQQECEELILQTDGRKAARLTELKAVPRQNKNAEQPE
ncbi:MAG: hypothetical protein HPZ79_07735 [Oscillospiraceae bacterium]|nr:hypothetical protein [Oscillospiraceae bacterium]